MADIEITETAIEAQRAYDAADERVRKLVSQLPPSTALASGEAEVTEEQREAFAQARDDRLAALSTLRNERARIDGEPIRVEKVLREAARTSAQ
ncbi:hypothetical protein ACFMQL_20665 [Nonomuraea fastidiosa]|uniref:hypothetical protein n=1 Tax=Nonomuraea fastidiosa TaxID=46173 RepID=UPI0036730C81